jgi:hypothetical protein
MIGNKPINGGGKEKNILEYTVGEVIEKPTLRNYKGVVYLLDEGAGFPFTCEDQYTEFEAGYWIDIIERGQVQKYVSVFGDGPVNDSWHNAIVLIKANASIVFSEDLRGDLSFTCFTSTGVTATFAASAGTTISANSHGTILPERSSCTVFTDGYNNHVLIGELV